MHEHNHSHNTANSPEETLALLNYMLGHNRRHAEELHELAHKLPETEAALLHEAVEDFNRGSEKLAGVLAMMKGV
ncbi:MAG: hypothetical protein HFH13_10090 [Dorea sp.]|jgi:hypothetical protein|nr:hypothetical protein [Dorea sp.]